MKRDLRTITFSCYASMFFLGVGATVIGAAARNIGLSPYQIGLIMAVQNIGFMISVMLSGSLSDTYEKTKILFVGSIVLGLAFLTFYLDDSFLLNCAIMFFIGIGMGSYEGTTDTMLLEMHEEKQNFHINVNHFFVTFGSLMITLYLIFLQMNWRKSLTQSAVAVFILAILFLTSKRTAEKQPVEKLSKRLAFLVQQKIVILLFFTTICAVGLELGNVVIMTTFLMDLREFSQVTSKVGLCVFLAGIAIGRLIAGFFIKKHKLIDNLILLFGLTAIFSGMLYLIRFDRSNETLNYVFMYCAIFLCGTTVSALLPIIITLAGEKYKELSGTVLGIIKLAIPVGGILIPFLISVISNASSFQLSLLIFPAIATASFLAVLVNKNSF